MPEHDPIMLLTGDHLGAVLLSLLESSATTPKVILLGQDPGAVVTHLLQREGYQVVIADSTEAIDQALALQPDLVMIEAKVLARLRAKLPPS